MRKIREALITIHLEKELKKERILEIYLNIIEWGPGIYGVESAAQCYFNKSASQLSLSESLRLASVISNPIAYNPLDDENSFLKLSQYRKSYRMLERHWIDLRTFVQMLAELNTPIPSEYANTLCRTLCFQQMVFLI
jgi:monofunctional biosynthetic peptidoglycan transglycosylase